MAGHLPSPAQLAAVASNAWPAGFLPQPPQPPANPPTVDDVRNAEEWKRNVAHKHSATAAAPDAARVTDEERVESVVYLHRVVADRGGFGPGQLGVPGLNAGAWQTAQNDIRTLQNEIQQRPTGQQVQHIADASAHAAVQLLSAPAAGNNPGGGLTQINTTLATLTGAIDNLRADITGLRADITGLRAATANSNIRLGNQNQWTHGSLRPLQKSTAGVHPNFDGVRDSLSPQTRDQRMDQLLGFHTLAGAQANPVQLGQVPTFGPFAGGQPPVTQAVLMTMHKETLACLRLFYAEDFGIVDSDSTQQQLVKFMQWLRWPQ